MSDFDSNPFADPEAVNPFADPSIQRAARGMTRPQGGLDDFNPFEEGNQTKPGGGPAAIPPPRPAQPMGQPAIMQPSEEPPPYSANAAQRIDTSELQKRQEELERKAAELQRKEQEMRNMSFQERKNNWPPLPKFCPVGPCFYQDFSVDIPLEFQRTVKFVYYLWMFYFFTLFLNVLGSLAYFIVSSSGVMFGLSFLWLVLFTPCSFICWYRPLYKAFRSDSSFNFFVFFFIFFAQFICCLIMCLGVTNFTVGWINALEIIKDHVAAGAMMLFIALFFSICAVLMIIMLVKIHRIYRSTGASFAKAQQEFSSNVMKNETVQNAAANAASGAAKGLVNQYGTGNKY
ncbi:hypothetical protein ACJMK2_043799 [Sinanodonta woodiana]|uniref:Secretory carrier-associated membrane protein n=1 Tax=Sinanodonta woodiana TaxID=1069815 RepID=A0ABD3VYJ3_SINWO